MATKKIPSQQFPKEAADHNKGTKQEQVLSHFAYEYGIICERDIYKSLSTDVGGSLNSALSSKDWLGPAWEHDMSNMIDPLRAKNLRFWYNLGDEVVGPSAVQLGVYTTYFQAHKFEMFKNPADSDQEIGGELLTHLGVNKKVYTNTTMPSWYPNPRADGESLRRLGNISNNQENSHSSFSSPYGFRIEERMVFECLGADEDPDDGTYLKALKCYLLDNFVNPSWSAGAAGGISPGQALPLAGDTIALTGEDTVIPAVSLSKYGRVSPTTPSDQLNLALRHYFTSHDTNRIIPHTGFESQFGYPMYEKKYWDNPEDSDGTTVATVDGIYTDSAFKMPSLISKQIQDVASSPALEGHGTMSSYTEFPGVVTPVADVDPVYNFVVPAYEKASMSKQPYGKNAEVHETWLPNLYDMLNLKGETDASGFDNAYLPLIKGADSNAWFAKYIDTIPQLEEGPTTTRRNSRSHIFISDQNKFSYENVNEHKSSFPMYVDINFRTSESGPLMKELKNAGASRSLLKSILVDMFRNPQQEEGYINAYNRHYQRKFSPWQVEPDYGPELGFSPLTFGHSKINYRQSTGLDYVATPARTDIFGANANTSLDADEHPSISHSADQGTRLHAFSVDKWISEVVSDAKESEAVLENLDIYTTFYSDDSESSKDNNPIATLLKEILAKAQLVPKINNIVQKKTRSHADIMSGKLAYSEILYYRIEKIAHNENGNPIVVQNFWIENTPGATVNQYIDTQVKYGRKYVYRIHAYTAVIGTKYRYSMTASPPHAFGWATKTGDPDQNPYGFTFTASDKQAWQNAFDEWMESENPGSWTDGPIGLVSMNGGTGQGSEIEEATLKSRLAAYSNTTKEGFPVDHLITRKSGMGIVSKTPSEMYQEYANSPFETSSVSPQLLMRSWDDFSEATRPLKPIFQRYPFFKAALKSYYDGQLHGFYVNSVSETYDLNKSWESEDMERMIEAAWTESQHMQMAIATIPAHLWKMASAKVISEPYVKIMEIPLYQESVSIIDDPPLAPQVNVLPFKDINNRIMFCFENTTGQHEAKPYYFPVDFVSNLPDGMHPMDQEQKVRIKQDRNYLYANLGIEVSGEQRINENIIFSADDYPGFYQIFRSVTRPTSYDSFATAQIKSLNAKHSSSFIDEILPNTKYYYTFRTIDRHGHPSNPSPVYEIEMVDDDGTVYMLISIIDFEDVDPPGSNKKVFQKFLQIDPAFLQTLVNDSSPDEGGTEFAENEDGQKTAFGTKPVIGVVSDSVYSGKVFKLRVSSRSSGKKIDINLKFKQDEDDGSQLLPPPPPPETY